MRKLFATIFAITFTMVTVATPWVRTKYDSPKEEVEKGERIESMQTLDVNSVKSAYNEFVKVASYDKVKYAPIMEQLLKIGNDGDQELKIKLSRQILLSNPLLDCDKILVAKYNLGDQATIAMAPSLGTQRNNWSNQTSAMRSGFDAEIAIISNLRGDEVKMDRIYKPERSTPISDLLLNWDGERILFTSPDENNVFNVFEIKTDGTGLKKVIKHNEPDLEFFDATYLPNGNIIASSNIGYQGVPCVHGADQVGNLVSYNVETENIRRITFDQDDNWHPRVMNNGKLLYARWEYTDMSHFFSRIVMHSNPDGTETKALYGSGSWFPNSVFDSEPLPGGNSTFIGIISGHHGMTRSGRLIVFDPTKGRKETSGMIQEIPFKGKEIIPNYNDRIVDGVWPQFAKPWPLSDKFFLVSSKMTPMSPWCIYLVDIYDNVTLIARDETAGFISPILLQERDVPPIIPDRVNLDDKEATFFIQDIYEGEGLPGVPRGTIKKLRVFAYEFTYVNTRAKPLVQGIQSGWDIKRILGEVDVEDDGSVMFKAPANTPISMQPLDSEGRAVQWMRSWVTGMPGEIVSCVGCHEDQNSMPIPKRTKASLSEPKVLEGCETSEEGIRSFTYNLEIQPILDRACIACHDDNHKLSFVKGDILEDLRIGVRRNFAQYVTVLSSDLGETHYMNKSYTNLHPYVHRQGPEGDMFVMKPYEYHASTSELVKILKRGHHGVELTDKEWKKLYTWIDLNAPMHGRFVYNQTSIKNCPTNAYDRRIELTNKYGNGAGVEWKKELEDYTQLLEAKGAITPVMPDKVDAPKYKDAKAKGFPFSVEEAKTMVAGDKNRKVIEIAKGVNIEFIRIPAGTFVMGDNNKGQNNNKPESKVKIDKAFWMATTELTNEQYNVIVPEHDSRFINRFRHQENEGMPANLPQQPVIRITWNEAMDYCNDLSEQCDVSFTLPTEAQWEWACRAGSETSMWYGESDIDYGLYENMGDQKLAEMRLSGERYKLRAGVEDVVSQYIGNVFDFLPRDNEVLDNNIIASEVGQYEPNPWGLYDMHGNVCEFTRSSYAPYPYNSKAKDDLKVYRGGSWLSRAKNSTSYSRNEMYAWQSSYTVGFRLVIEE